MQLGRTSALISRLRAHMEATSVSQVALSKELGLSPQNLSLILRGTNCPNSETTLQIIEIIEPKSMKTDFLDPRATPRPTINDLGRPKTLSAALDRIEALESQLLQLRGSAPKPVLTSPAPGRIQAATPTRHGIVADRPPEQKLPEKLTLPASAITPFLAGEIIKITPTDSLRRMLDSETISWRKAALYRAIKEREKLATY